MMAKIVSFMGTWGSGLAILILDTKDGRKSLYCDNGATVRALNALFPGFITSGHRIDNGVIKGQEIEYEMDDMGLILGRIWRVD